MMGRGYSAYDIDDYDEDFAKAEIKWYPWVGKDYEETEILFLGDRIAIENGNDWTQDFDSEPNRELVYKYGIKSERETGFFARTTQMFLEGASQREFTREARQAFWESVAFVNFCQCPVEKNETECPDECIEESNKSLDAIFDILSPQLCIVLSTELEKYGFQDIKECEKIDGDIPRYTNPPCLAVGIKCPSTAASHSDWLNYLLTPIPQGGTPRLCNELVENLLDRLYPPDPMET